MANLWSQPKKARQRLDSESVAGMALGAILWIRQPAVILDRASNASRTNHQQLEVVPQPVSLLNFEITTTNSRVEPGVQETYVLLPFRALEEDYLPSALQQRWEASVAASKCAEWRMWFQTLDPAQQKAHVQNFAKSTKEKFWAALWLEYEEWSKPRNPRCIAAAARATRAQVLFERELIRRQMEKPRAWYEGKLEATRAWHEAERAWQERARLYRQLYPHDHIRTPITWPHLPEPLSGPLSAPLTAQNIISLKLRLVPNYFRVPDSAFRFATQIFSGKSYEEAVAEQKANFNSWTREHSVRRSDGHPGFAVHVDNKAHKDDAKSIAKME